MLAEAFREAVDSHVALARGKCERIDYAARFNGLSNRRLKTSARRDVKTPLDSITSFYHAVNEAVSKPLSMAAVLRRALNGRG